MEMQLLVFEVAVVDRAGFALFVDETADRRNGVHGGS